MQTVHFYFVIQKFRYYYTRVYCKQKRFLLSKFSEKSDKDSVCLRRNTQEKVKSFQITHIFAVILDVWFR